MALRTSLAVQPHLYMGDTAGRPLDGGKVYFGQVNKDPEFYPINVFYDEALTIPAMQPVRTKGGFMYANGDMTEIYALETRYSVKVLDSYGRQVFYKEDMQSGLDVSDQLGSISEMLALVGATTGQKVFVEGLQGGTFIYDSSKSAINDGGLIFDGWVRDIRDKRITPEMFGAKPNDAAFDNTTALNAAFATGFDLYGLPTDIYHVTTSIRTKGQKTYGGWKIHSNKATGRAGVWNKLVSTNDTGLDTSNNIRMLYVSSSWDFAELLAIKELGFNTVHHYVSMASMGWDWDGDVFDLLNNAMTAGLKVSLGTEHAEAVADLPSWVESVDSYPAVWAYSVYDEPVARGFSVAQQDARIVTLRGLTKKMLTVVDYKSNPFLQNYSTNYDLCFVNSYARAWSTNAQSQNLDKMRMDYGVLKAQVGCPVIPCISAFTQVTAGMYASSVSEVVQSSSIFGRVARGSFSAFAWDGESDASITAAVRDNVQLQNLVRGLCNAVLPKPLETDVYLFGNANTQTNWGLTDVLGNLAMEDTTSADPATINAYPIQLTKGTVDSDRVSSTSTTNYAGIGFKGARAKLVTTIPLRKYLKSYLESVNVDGNIPFQTISLCSTADGYTLKHEHNANSLTTDNSLITGSYIIDNPNGRTLAFRYVNDSSVVKQYYRQLIRGIIICSDW